MRQNYFSIYHNHIVRLERKKLHPLSQKFGDCGRDHDGLDMVEPYSLKADNLGSH